MESVIAKREEVERFLSTTSILGYGYRDGSGRGDRYGDGEGYGHVEGRGNHYGNGDGDGYGYGYYGGDGDEDAYGCGIRCGRGNDDGCGYCGDFENIKALNGNIVDYVDSLPTIITQVHGNIACGYIVKDDLTLSPCFIAKAGNSFAHGDTLKFAVEDAEDKEFDKVPIEERIKKFVETFGSLDTEHNGKEFYDWHHFLTGSCKMGRDEFCRIHNIDLKKKYTVRYFLDITKESYGRDVIKLIRKEYKEIEK